MHVAGQPARLDCAFAFCPVCISDDKAFVYWCVAESGNALSRKPPALCLDCSTPQDGPVATVYCDQFRNAIREAHSLARQHLHATAQTQKRCFDARVKPVSFHTNQLVWLFWPRPLLRQKQRKLVNLWTGPWKILRYLSPITVVVQHVNTHKKQTVHVDRLMPCRSESLNEAPDVPEVPIEHQTSSGSATGFDVPSTPFPPVTRAGRTVKTPARYL